MKEIKEIISKHYSEILSELEEEVINTDNISLSIKIEGNNFSYELK